LANSTLVTDLKQAVIKEIVNDDAFFYAINSPEVTDIKKEADEQNAYSTSALMDNYIANYSKILWMLKQMLEN